MTLSSLPSLDDVQRQLALRSLNHFLAKGWRSIDPSPFLPNWHIDVIGEHFTDVVKGRTRRLIVNIPPRMIKSIFGAVALPAWTWVQPEDPAYPLQGPGVRFLYASYAHTLSLRDSTKTRRLIESPWYRSVKASQIWSLGPDYYATVDAHGREVGWTPTPGWELQKDQNTKTKFENTAGGYRLATSVDGALTGEGGDIIVIDDAHNAKEVQSDVMLESVANWWDHAMSTRLNNPKIGAYIVIMQRLHHRDLTGHLLAKDYGGWTHLCLPMEYEPDHPYVYGKDPRTKPGALLHEARVGPKEVEQLKKDLGQYGAAGQLQQRPAPREGGLFKRHYFQRAGALPHDVVSVRGWDLASTSTLTASNPDWTYTILLSKQRSTGKYFLSKGRQFREQGAEVELEMMQTAKHEGKRIGIAIPQDPGQAGKSQAQYYVKKLAGWIVYINTMSGDKIVRATPWSLQAEQLNFFIVYTDDPNQDAWIEPFLSSVTIFPNGDHDDDVDAVSLAFEAIESGLALPQAALPHSIEAVSPFEI